jgi:hypothetical protein
MRDGQGLVGFALFAYSVGPVSHGQVSPVVVALLQLDPGVFQDLLPGFVTEQWPERRSRDLYAVVEVRLVGGRQLEQGVAQLDQLQLEGLQGLKLLFVVARSSSATSLSLGSMKSLMAVYNVWLVRPG